MRLEFDKFSRSIGTASQGLEISVAGFKSNPVDAESDPVQVYIEIYEGKLWVHVWDGSSEDPQSIVIDPLD